MRKKFTILSVSALLALVSLASCSNSSDCPVCEEKPDDNDDNNPSDNPGGNPDGNPDDPLPDVPDPSEGLIDKEESPWNEEITNLMFNSLGGAILPFVDLGDGEIQAEYVKNDEDNDYKSYLELVGGSFLASHLEKAVETYKEHYWNTVMVGDSFYASNELIDVSVEVSKNYNNLFELRAYYDEPFNPADATEWDDVTSLLISEHFGRFEVPFTYLGTVNYDSSITSEGALLVTGGTWNDQVLSQFRTSFGNWTITTDDDELTTLYATHEVDGTTLNATLAKVNNKAQLTVSLSEAFDATNQTSWSSEVLAAMNRSLNKNVLPYIYLGCVYPTIDTAKTNERNLTLVGKLWDDSILEAAKTAFEAEEGWEVTSGEISVTFSKTIGFEDYEVVVEKNTDGVPVLRASREELYNEDSLTDYTEEIKTAFKDKYGEEISIIPYLYLGTSSPILNTEIPAKHEDIYKLVITGGKYDPRILERFKEKFSKDAGWYSETENSYEEDPVGDESDGSALAVAIKSFEEYTYKVGLFTLGTGEDETAYLEINRSNNTGVQATEWSDETLANLETVFGSDSDVKIPYFDTGRDTLEIVFNEYGHLEIQFLADETTFSYRVWCVIDALTKDGWDVTLAHNYNYFNDEVWISSINATKDFNGKKVKINITVNPNYYYRFVMFGSISLDETYDPAKEEGSWSEEIKTQIKERYNIDLPYIYLGTDRPYIFEDPDEGELMIIGNAWNKDKLLNNAKEVLTAYDFLIDNSESHGKVVATKTNSDGNIVTVYVDSNDGKPYIALSLTEVFNPGGKTEWSQDIQDTLAEELPEGVTIPYMYLGTVSPSISVEDDVNGKKITIVGGNWDNAVISLAKDYTSESQFTVGTTSETFYGYLMLEDKTAVRMQISENYDDLIELNIYVDKKPEATIDGVATWESFPEDYGESISDYMMSGLGFELPKFIPLGIAPSKDNSVRYSGPYNVNSNKYMSMNCYYSTYKAYYLYVAMDNLKALGYEVTFNPFAIDEMAGFVAKMSDDNGGTTMITLKPSSGDYNDDENGLNMSAIYLPSMNEFGDVTDFAESDKINIDSALDGLALPYANLGSEVMKIDTKNGQVSITGYNYSEAIIDSIRVAYSNADWTLNDTYVIQNGTAYKTIGGTLVQNGHTYVLTVTPSVSNAVNGVGTFSSSSITTKLVIQMA